MGGGWIRVCGRPVSSLFFVSELCFLLEFETNYMCFDTAIGNSWAALGMLHVHTTILRSQFSSQMSRQATELLVWTREIIDSSFNAMVRLVVQFSFLRKN